MSANASKCNAFIASHLGTIRIFALWGILDLVVYILARNDRIKTMALYMTIFLTITLVGFYIPAIFDSF